MVGQREDSWPTRGDAPGRRASGSRREGAEPPSSARGSARSGSFRWESWRGSPPAPPPGPSSGRPRSPTGFRRLATFVVPYLQGDVSDGSWRGSGLFWENYGYVGLATLLLAAAASFRRRAGFPTRAATALVVASLLVVLGSSTPVYPFLFRFLPGLDRFRMPTRFLFLACFGLALLGGLGLSRFESWLARRRERGGLPLPAYLVAAAIVLATSAELVYFQRRQNPFGDADAWLSPPWTAAAIRQLAGADRPPRTWSVAPFEEHAETFAANRGWAAGVAPFLALHPLLGPNLGLLWGIPTVNGYAGIAPQGAVDLWGDHNQGGIAQQLYRVERGRILVSPGLFRLASVTGVRFAVSHRPLAAPPGALRLVETRDEIRLWELPPPLPRTRFVGSAFVAPTEAEAAHRLLDPSVDPATELVLHGVDGGMTANTPSVPAGSGEARIVRDRIERLEIDATAPTDGWLLVADTWHPGWIATVDGRPAPIRRANFGQRAVRLPAGHHEVTFRFVPRSVVRGAAISGAALTVAFVALLLARPRRD